MIAVDTNVLVRLIVADDASQGERAEGLFARSAEVFVAKTVVLETAWVLQSAYGFPRHDVARALRRLAGLPNVVIEDAEQVAFALDLASHDVDGADALHVAAGREAGTCYTFDRRLIRQGDLTRISHQSGCIGPRNLRKVFCDKHLADPYAGSDADTVYLRTASFRRV